MFWGANMAHNLLELNSKCYSEFEYQIRVCLKCYSLFLVYTEQFYPRLFKVVFKLCWLENEYPQKIHIQAEEIIGIKINR